MLQILLVDIYVFMCSFYLGPQLEEFLHKYP